MVDCPGSGEALRFLGLTARVDTEHWATACVDYLHHRDDVEPARIGLVGWSLGGYYAPRAAALEKRLALCVAWGGNHDWGAIQKRRLQREGENPVPHYWNHVLWVWGEADLDTFITMAEAVNLDGVVEHIAVPFLIVHGENDRQTRSRTRSTPSTGRSTARNANYGSSPPPRARPSTSASTTFPTSAPSSPTGSPTPSPSSRDRHRPQRPRGRHPQRRQRCSNWGGLFRGEMRDLDERFLTRRTASRLDHDL